MKKVLFASVAAVALTAATGAMAAEPIKLGLGGFSKWMVAYAGTDGTFEGTNEYEDLDIQGDNEIWFSGSTTLDNGLKIGVKVELEAGGGVETAGGQPNTGDVVDESFITVDSSFGRIILGSEDNGAYLLHVSAPDAAGLLEEQTVRSTTWGLVVNPGNFSAADTTAINTDGDAEKITYVAPSFAGFTVGASYIPNATQDIRTPRPELEASDTLSDIWGVAAGYNNTFNGVGVKASVGYVKVAETNGDVAGEVDDHQEWSAGLQVGFAGFTVGGGYRKIDQDLIGGGEGATDGNAWTVGAMYTTGPFAVSAAFFHSEAAGEAADTDDDEYDHWQVSGKYNMGPGIDAVAVIGHQEFDGEGDAGVGVEDNDGMFVLTGLALGF